MRQALQLAMASAIIFGPFLAASVSADERDYIIDIRPLVTDIRKISELKPLVIGAGKSAARSNIVGEKTALKKKQT